LRAELEARGVPVKDGHRGYRLLVVEDLDGNQLFFNYPPSTLYSRCQSVVLEARATMTDTQVLE